MARELGEDDLWGEKAEEAHVAYLRSKRLRSERPSVRDIIRVLWRFGTGVSMQRLTGKLWQMRSPTGLPMPRQFKKTVQSFLNQPCASSDLRLNLYLRHVPALR